MKTRRHHTTCVLLWIGLVIGILLPRCINAQAGLRESLEKLDKNKNGFIDPDEVTPLARPFLERIRGNNRDFRDRTSITRPIPISQIQEEARYYFAVKNGQRGRDVRPEGEDQLKDFELGWDQAIVPEFGIAKIRFPYTRADLNEVENTMRRCDSNQDGFIDRGEAWRNRWTHRNPFDDDVNKDGKLSRLELAQRYARRRLVSQDSYQIYKKTLRTGSDVKRSVFDPRELARQEYFRNRGITKRLSMDLFARFDTNRDRSLDKDEVEPIGIPFIKLDIDNNGIASREEVEEVMALFQAEAGGQQEGVPPWFYELDKNRDDQLEMAEFTEEWSDAKVKEFEQYDLNSDGLVTAKELVNASMRGGQFVSSDAEIFAPKKSLVSEIEISDNIKIANLKLHLSLTHTYLAQIEGFLVGPDGQKVTLFGGVGGSDDNFQNTVFDDNSSTPITKARAPFRGSYRPQALDRKQPGLAHFRGKSAKGVWKLVIGGPRNSRFGMVHQWGLTVETE